MLAMDVRGYKAGVKKMLRWKVFAYFDVASQRSMSNAHLPSACNISTAGPVMLTRLVMF